METIQTLKTFLIERKTALDMNYKMSLNKRVRERLEDQIKVIEVILIHLNKPEQERNDMAALKLTLDAQAKPLEELAPRARKSELGAALAELATQLKPNTHIPLNAPGIKAKSVVAKLYEMKRKGQLPKNIGTATRGNVVSIVMYEDEQTARDKRK